MKCDFPQIFFSIKKHVIFSRYYYIPPKSKARKKCFLSESSNIVDLCKHFNVLNNVHVFYLTI